MMQGPHDRASDTQEVMRRFREAATRRRRLRLIAFSAGAVMFVALVAIVLVLTWPSEHQVALAGTTATDGATTTRNTTTALAVDESATTNTLPPTTNTPSETAVTAVRDRYVVAIDPGHQARANSELEPIGPGSSRTKAKVSSGTRSINTGLPESQLVLEVALKLRDSLEAQGVRVVMTRTTQDVNISNIERAQVANQAGADLFVRIHADGAVDTSIHGVLMLYPATIEGWTDDISAESKRAAQIALDALLATTGAKDRGLVARSDLTGFNWSDVPVILPEIGLMTNEAEDILLASDDYQGKIIQGLTDAILDYLDVR